MLLHPTLKIALHYFTLFPGVFCYLKSSWVRERVSLTAVSFPQWTLSQKAEGMDHLVYCGIPSPIIGTQQVLNKCLLSAPSLGMSC